MGSYDGEFQNADVYVSAQCNRVAVLDGHSESVFVELERPAGSVEEVLAAFASLEALDLPSAPNPPLVLLSEADRPQPRLDRNNGKGMATSVGRVRLEQGGTLLKYNLLSHNTIRGAAGNAILSAELIVSKGMA